VKVLGPEPRKANLVARMRGSGKRRPLLMLAHLDVVDADPQEWTTHPFAFVEKDGYFYGRGTTDDKAMAAIWVANLVRFLQEGFIPDRDLILALTADEEGGPHNGATWLLEHRRELVDAAFGINEGGTGRARHGRYLSNMLQASEKVYVDFELVATGRAGHSSVPTGDNAIYHLADALRRIGEYRFPARLSEITRAFFDRMAAIESEAVAVDMRAILRDPPDPVALERLSAVPYYNGVLRTTCVATRLDAGQTNNTIPQSARAVLNCRLLPGESAEEVRQTLTGLVAGGPVEIVPLAPPKPSPPSPLTDEIMRPVERITEELWPGVPVVPVMGIGATDSLRFRQAGIPMYGVSGIFYDMDDVRAHCPDERIETRSFYDGLEFLHRLVRSLSS
jgi:acetylornithine deacetylase/succinyl-diaminopimelate desuccinylase-like protein